MLLALFTKTHIFRHGNMYKLTIITKIKKSVIALHDFIFKQCLKLLMNGFVSIFLIN